MSQQNDDLSQNLIEAEDLIRSLVSEVVSKRKSLPIETLQSTPSTSQEYLTLIVNSLNLIQQVKLNMGSILQSQSENVLIETKVHSNTTSNNKDIPETGTSDESFLRRIALNVFKNMDNNNINNTSNNKAKTELPIITTKPISHNALDTTNYQGYLHLQKFLEETSTIYQLPRVNIKTRSIENQVSFEENNITQTTTTALPTSSTTTIETALPTLSSSTLTTSTTTTEVSSVKFDYEDFPTKGWKKEIYLRLGGKTKGKVDIHYCAPDNVRKFRSKGDLQIYMEREDMNLAYLDLFEFQSTFCVCQKPDNSSNNNNNHHNPHHYETGVVATNHSESTVSSPSPHTHSTNLNLAHPSIMTTIMDHENTFIECSYGKAGCNTWVHPQCVGLGYKTKEEIQQMKKIICPFCVAYLEGSGQLDIYTQQSDTYLLLRHITTGFSSQRILLETSSVPRPPLNNNNNNNHNNHNNHNHNHNNLLPPPPPRSLNNNLMMKRYIIEESNLPHRIYGYVTAQETVYRNKSYLVPGKNRHYIHCIYIYT
jgi:hypothetical protein